MLGLFTKKNDENAELITRSLSRNVVAVVSASCCMQGTDETDQAVSEVARKALDSRGLDWPLMTVTVTQAQSSLASIAGSLDERGGQVAQQVSELFMSQGLTAFPVLIVNQQVIAYGGVPDVELVQKALPAAVDAQRDAMVAGSA